jgi:hypothetical protein
MVIGNHKMVEAYATGFPIRISSYAGSNPVGFTRPWAHAWRRAHQSAGAGG